MRLPKMLIYFSDVGNGCGMGRGDIKVVWGISGCGISVSRLTRLTRLNHGDYLVFGESDFTHSDLLGDKISMSEDL